MVDQALVEGVFITSQSNKEKERGEMIIELIEKGLQKERDNRNKKRESHYPSDISACKRQLYYKWTDEPVSNPVTAGGMLKMKMGTAIHDIVPNLLELAGLESVPEIAVKKSTSYLKYPISGRIDNLFIIPGTDSLGVIEVKTSYGAGVKALQKTGKPRESDANQLLTYLWLEPTLAKGILIYIGRDNGYRTEFEVDRDNDKVECIIVNKLKDLERRVFLRSALQGYTDDQLPDREYSVAIKNGEIKDKYQKDKVVYKSMWNCEYCSYESICWKEIVEKSKGKMFYGEREVGRWKR